MNDSVAEVSRVMNVPCERVSVGVLIRRFGRQGAVLCAVCALGCGGETTGTVSGTVTLEGEPFADGFVVFQEAVRGEGASAPVTSGKFAFESALPTGEYKVYIDPPTAPPPTAETAGQPPPTAGIPDAYRSGSPSTPLTAKVEEGENAFEFKVAK